MRWINEHVFRLWERNQLGLEDPIPQPGLLTSQGPPPTTPPDGSAPLPRASAPCRCSHQASLGMANE